VALWGYFEDGARGEGRDEGATTVCSLAGGGWIWHIPMANRMTSVGVVARVDQFSGDLQDRETAYGDAIAEQPWVSEQLTRARRSGPLRLTRNYSYFGSHTGKPGLMLCGDAFAFLDPVFSSGMYIALTSGAAAADLIAQARVQGGSRSETTQRYREWFTTHIEPMRRLIYSFYDPGFSVGQLMRDRPDLRGDLTDILVGNLDRDFDELMKELGARTDLPEPLAQRIQRGAP
jgi:flavin-dependent dehydrogenase